MNLHNETFHFRILEIFCRTITSMHEEKAGFNCRHSCIFPFRMHFFRRKTMDFPCLLYPFFREGTCMKPPRHKEYGKRVRRKTASVNYSGSCCIVQANVFKMAAAISSHRFSSAKCPLATGMIIASGRSFLNASAPLKINEGSSFPQMARRRG